MVAGTWAAAAVALALHGADALIVARRGNSTAAPFDCYEGTGADYVGLKDMTASGRTCKNWVDEGSYSPTVKGIGNHNYCRNPEGSKAKPWCFTMDPAVPFELCEVPECPADGGAVRPWMSPPGAKSSNLPCRYTPPATPGFAEYKAGRACMDNQGDKWWLITNQRSEATSPEACEMNCKTLVGTKFFTFYAGAAEGKCGCYRECVLVAEDLTVDLPTVYKVD